MHALLSLLIAPALLGAPQQAGETPAAPAAPAAPTAPTAIGRQEPLPERPTDAYRLRLLDLAYQAASAIPSKPQIKERSQSQEEVVLASLELDQPKRALSFIAGIENWRKGVCFAELASYCAEHGCTADVQTYLDLAEDVAKQAVGEEEQQWRIDRIRATIAKTYLQLGDTEQAARFGEGLEPSEVGRVLAVQAVYLDAEGFDEELKAVDRIVEIHNFDQVKNALDGLVPVFDRFYEDPDRRARVQEKVLASWGKMPAQVRLDLALALAGTAVAHGDKDNARALIDEGRKALDGFQGTAEQRVPMLANLARMRGEAGDADGARREIDAALAEFERGLAELVDYRRPDALRPVAEAYASLGHRDAALMVYKRAVEEGALNANTRPRAEDLASTCCSMALKGVEPDERMWERMTAIKAGLKDPWQASE
jgi:tetratricopeptide (TPR) repeat protein